MIMFGNQSLACCLFLTFKVFSQTISDTTIITVLIYSHIKQVSYVTYIHIKVSNDKHEVFPKGISSPLFFFVFFFYLRKKRRTRITGQPVKEEKWINKIKSFKFVAPLSQKRALRRGYGQKVFFFLRTHLNH